MTLQEVEFQELVDFYDHIRIPLSSFEREKRQGPYRYYGAQSVIDHVDEYLFDGEYVLIAEDGANLVTRNEPIAQVVSGQFWVNNHAHVVQAKEGVSTNNFINFLINSNNISSYVTGAAQPKLSQKNIRIIKFDVPSYEEQLAIDDLISKYNNLIENNRCRIKLLEEAARQLYKEWFVRFRFPGYEHAKIVKGIPDEWRRTILGEIADIQKGKNITKAVAEHGDVPVVAGGLKPAYYHSTANVPGPVITVSASGANAGYVSLYHVDIWASDCSFLSAAQNAEIWFLYLLMKSDQVKITGMQQGAAQPHVYPKHLERLSIVLPSLDVRKFFNEKVDAAFRQIAVLERQNRMLSRARDLLLPRLMSGEIAA